MTEKFARKSARYAAATAALCASAAFSAAHAQLPAPDAVAISNTAGSATPIHTPSLTARPASFLGAGLSRIATAADGDAFVVANATTSSLDVLDGATLALRRRIALTARPAGIVVAPDGASVYVLTAASQVERIDLATGAQMATYAVPGTTGDLAITADGGTVLAAAGVLSLIDTATGAVTVTDIAAAGAVVVTPDGSRAFVTTLGTDIFGGSAAVQVVDVATRAIIGYVGYGGFLGQLAITPDGSRVYVGLSSTFVDTGYGAGFFPSRTVGVIDAASAAAIASIDLGASGNNWTQQNTAGRLAVAPDRSSLLVIIPRLSAAAVVDVNTNLVRGTIAAGTGLADVSYRGDANATLVTYQILARDDAAPAPFPNSGGVAIPSVLTNDLIGGARAALGSVTLSTVSSTDAGVELDTASGALRVRPGAGVGPQEVRYRVCERAAPDNCAEAVARVTVRLPFIVDAVDDTGAVNPGRTAIVSVLANDTLNGAPATTANTRVTQLSSTSPSVQLYPHNGQVFVASNAPTGPQRLTYRLCELQIPTNCDDASIDVNVIPFAITAADDQGTLTRSGGTAIANVLANDSFAGAVATTAKVTLSQLSSTAPALTLNTATGAVIAAPGIPAGTHVLGYRICETLNPVNCAQAAANVTVTPYTINAVDDSGRGSSKVVNTVIANVLANDRFGNDPASLTKVRLSRVSLSPANRQIKLDLRDGSVDVTAPTSSGLYRLTYRICEKALLTNCDTAVVTIDLSGGGSDD